MDISQTNWTEADASNSTSAPDGWPEGMQPSGVNDSGRGMMGAIKRWYNQMIPLVTGGTSTAYTLSYAVTPTALADGQTHLVQFNAVNGAAATLNVNALGAKPLHFYSGGAWGACPANMFAIDQIVRVAYNAAAGTYRCLDLPLVLQQSAAGASTVDFTGIPSNVNNLRIEFEFRPSADNVAIVMQTYGAAGALATGSSDYSYWATVIKSDLSSAVGASTTSSISFGGSSDNGSNGYGCILTAQNIQALTNTKFQFHSSFLDQAGSLGVDVIGTGQRNEADRITGFRLSPSSGTITGKITVTMS